MLRTSLQHFYSRSIVTTIHSFHTHCGVQCKKVASSKSSKPSSKPTNQSNNEVSAKKPTLSMPKLSETDLKNASDITPQELEELQQEVGDYVKEYSIAEWEHQIKDYERWQKVNMMEVQDPDTGFVTPESLLKHKVISDEEYKRMCDIRDELDLYYQNFDFSPKGAKRRRLAKRSRNSQQKKTKSE